MKRIVVVGNSHIIAMRDAWHIIKDDYPRLNLNFFGTSGGIFQHLRIDSEMRFGCVQGVELNPNQLAGLRRDAGAETINLHDADAVIYVGFVSYERPIAKIIAEFNIDGLCSGSEGSRMSAAAYRDFVEDVARKAMPAEMWDGECIPSLVFVPTPRPSVDCSSGTLPIYEGWKRLIARNSEVANSLDVYLDRLEEIFASRAIRMVRHPAAALADSGLTRSEFSRGSATFQANIHGAEDFFHMNRDYGRLQLIDTLSALRLV